MATSGKQLLSGSSHPRWFAFYAGLLVLLGMASAFVGWDAWSSAAPDRNRAMAGAGGAVGALIAIAVASLLTKQELVVDSDGIEARKRGKATRIRWSEPHELYYRAIDTSGTPVVERAVLRTPDGRSIDVDDAHHAGSSNVKAPKLVEQTSTTAMWPKIQARLQAGEDIEFGAATVSMERLKLGERTYSMSSPISLQVENGRIKVGAEGQWSESGVGVREVANYSCLLRAIGQVTQARAPV